MKKECSRLINYVIFFFSISLLSLIAYFILAPQEETYKVVRVIDGDTFAIETGEKVRLICIDAPERYENGYNESSAFLSQLILNKKVRLEKDISEKDDYGRLLRYVYLDSIFVNKELVRKGFAKPFSYGNDTRLCNEISS